MEVTLTIIFVAFICFLTQWYMKNRRYLKLLDRFPNPPTVPIIGNALDFKSPTDFIPKFAEYRQLYGDIVKLYLGPLPSKLVITDIRLIRHILSSTTILQKGMEYGYFSKWLGNGLLITDGGSRWKKHRKLIAPSFHIQVFKNFIEAFESNSNILLNKLEKEVGKDSFDMYPYITLLSLDIICETAMGTSINAQDNSRSEYVESVKFMCRLLVKRAFNASLRSNFFYQFSSLCKEEKRAVDVLHSYTKGVIERRKQSKTNVQNVSDDNGVKEKMVLLDLLLQQNEKAETFTDVELREEVDTFLFAGHDTTASALTFAIYSLAENPAVQEKVVEELHEIFTDDKFRSITFNDVQSMRYLEAVIKEVLRLYPSVPYYSRTLEKEFEFDGYTIPVGVSLLLNIYGLHHDPKLFSEPEKFRPERFIGQNEDERQTQGYYPFSMGPRNCIGQKFAMLEMKTVLAVLLRYYKFLPTIPKHKLNLSTETVLLSHNGVRVRIVKRSF